MKVLLINGSPHTTGSVYTALSYVEKALILDGIETEVIHIGNLTIRGCLACNYCKTHYQCACNDIVNEVAIKFKEADGLVLGCPVYYGSANGTMISFLDRLFYSANFDKSMKVGACVVSARRSGTTATFDELNKYFTLSNMPVVSSKYWNNIHGNNAEEALHDLEALEVMTTLGHNMAFLIKCIQLGKEEFGLPPKGERIKTNFIR